MGGSRPSSASGPCCPVPAVAPALLHATSPFVLADTTRPGVPGRGRLRVEGRAQIADRCNAVVEVRVVDRRDEPRRHCLNDEAIQLSVVVGPLLERLVRGLDLHLVDSEGLKADPEMRRKHAAR